MSGRVPVVTSNDPSVSPPTDDVPSQPQAEEDESSGGIPFWIEFPILIGVALVIAVLIKTFLFQAFFIPSSSMENTLQIDDRVLVNKITYQTGDIARGDVIVFDDPRGGFDEPDENVIEAALRNLFESIGLVTPKSEFIKRVIGLPGDTVEGRDGIVYINGQPLAEPYVKEPDVPIPPFGPVEVPIDSLFVMGDNRRASQDSRSFGPIPVEDVVGKAFVIIWPPGRWGGL